MVKNTIRCGNSNGIYSEAPRGPERRVPFTPPRKVIHFGSPIPAMREFRVIARLADESVALVCVADSRQEAVELAWVAWERKIPGVEAVFLERWTVADGVAGWSSLKAAKGELPEKPRFTRRPGKKEARKVSANGT